MLFRILFDELFDQAGSLHVGITQVFGVLIFCQDISAQSLSLIHIFKDLAAYDQFVFNKLTKVNGIVKMQSSFVLNEIKHTTALKVVPGE